MRKIVAGGLAALAVTAFAAPALAGCIGGSHQTVMSETKTSTQTAEAPSTPKPAESR